MKLKPPVVFTVLPVEKAVGGGDIEGAVRGRTRKADAVAGLWKVYAEALLYEAEPCMEASEGMGAVLACLSRRCRREAIAAREMGRGGL